MFKEGTALRICDLVRIIRLIKFRVRIIEIQYTYFDTW